MGHVAPASNFMDIQKIPKIRSKGKKFCTLQPVTGRSPRPSGRGGIPDNLCYNKSMSASKTNNTTCLSIEIGLTVNPENALLLEQTMQAFNTAATYCSQKAVATKATV